MDGRKVYPSEYFAINKFVQPIVKANANGTATLGRGVWLGIASTAGIGINAGMYIVCHGSTSQHGGSSLGGSSVGGGGTITYNGYETTVKINNIGLPVNWIQITNIYWF